MMIHLSNWWRKPSYSLESVSFFHSNCLDRMFWGKWVLFGSFCMTIVMKPLYFYNVLLTTCVVIILSLWSSMVLTSTGLYSLLLLLIHIIHNSGLARCVVSSHIAFSFLTDFVLYGFSPISDSILLHSCIWFGHCNIRIFVFSQPIYILKYLKYIFSWTGLYIFSKVFL